jgi:predicted short-subunit dehydrogenase-like oxidoreductase (DUF2520 family)
MSLGITIIGTGNVATHLALNLEKVGINVLEVYGRTKAKAKALAAQLYIAKVAEDLDFSESESDLFFLCVSDSAISEVAKEILLPEGTLLIHCSGATSMKEIARTDVAYGVFYPIQTFSTKHKVSFQDISLCLEASSNKAETTLEKLALKMGAKPCFMNSEQRLVLHVSAVFACNFSNHFYRIAHELLKEQGLPFRLLQNLVQETVLKAFELGPENAQTGPAVREDFKTMALHEKVLNQSPAWQELYSKISNNIILNKN